MQKGKVACPRVPQGQCKLEAGQKQASADLEESKQGEQERAWPDSTVSSSFVVKTSMLRTQPRPPISKDEFLVFTVPLLTWGPFLPHSGPQFPNQTGHSLLGCDDLTPHSNQPTSVPQSPTDLRTFTLEPVEEPSASHGWALLFRLQLYCPCLSFPWLLDVISSLDT